MRFISSARRVSSADDQPSSEAHLPHRSLAPRKPTMRRPAAGAEERKHELRVPAKERAAYRAVALVDQRGGERGGSRGKEGANERREAVNDALLRKTIGTISVLQSL